MKKKIIGIYKITNLVNNKVYIGSSIDCYRRLEFEHKKGTASNTLLQRAITKYGINNFRFEIIECCLSQDTDILTKQYLVERESNWIEYFDALNRSRGYNIESPTLNIRSEESKLKISRTQRNQVKKHNTSGVVGVRWDKERQKYVVTQSRNNRTYHLGRFSSLEKAQEIYLEFCKYDYEEFLIKREQLLQRKPKTSKYTGIHKCTRSGKYIAQIRVNKKNVVVGRYISEIEAVIAYNEYLVFNNIEGYLNIIYSNEYPNITEFNPPNY
jgi:group I intron endonuclease